MNSAGCPVRDAGQHRLPELRLQALAGPVVGQAVLVEERSEPVQGVFERVVVGWRVPGPGRLDPDDGGPGRGQMARVRRDEFQRGQGTGQPLAPVGTGGRAAGGGHGGGGGRGTGVIRRTDAVRRTGAALRAGAPAAASFAAASSTRAHPKAAPPREWLRRRTAS